MRRAARIDANHRAIVDLFRSCGARVLSLAPMGHGCPDLLVNVDGKLALVEVKDGAKKPSARQLTPDEAAFAQDWPVIVVKDDTDALKVLDALRSLR